jgi:hypothetical protein
VNLEATVTAFLAWAPYARFLEFKPQLGASLSFFESEAASEEQRFVIPVVRRALAVRDAAEWDRLATFALRQFMSVLEPIAKFEAN